MQARPLKNHRRELDFSPATSLYRQWEADLKRDFGYIGETKLEEPEDDIPLEEDPIFDADDQPEVAPQTTTAEDGDDWRKALNDRLGKTQSTLNEILSRLSASELFPNANPDMESRFWSTYERVAKQSDEELLEKHNSNLDVLLIFAGLFSAVSSTFIVDMDSDLTGNPSDTTNVLLTFLVQAAYNRTTPGQSIAPPQFNGPDSTTIWTQALAYCSLSLSLLAAFGAVLGKQWLSHFKTARSGHGTLSDRGLRRQQRVDGFKRWQFDFILEALPMMLQLSLLLFGMSLAGHLYSDQRFLGSMIVTIIAVGVVFYLWTILTAIRHPTSPFQFGLTRVGQMLPKPGVLWRDLPKRLFRRKLKTEGSLPLSISKSPSLSLTSDNFLAGPLYDSLPTGPLYNLLQTIHHKPTAVELEGFQSIKWIIETSTDPDTIATAASMIPRVFWPSHVDPGNIIEQLQYAFDGCYGSHNELLASSDGRPQAYYIAILHLFCLQLTNDIQTDDIVILRQWLRERIIRTNPCIQTSFKILVDQRNLETIPLGYCKSTLAEWTTHRFSCLFLRNPGWTINSCADVWIKLCQSPISKSVRANILFNMAITLGYRPDGNTISLIPDKSPYESTLLLEVLLRLRAMQSQHEEMMGIYRTLPVLLASCPSIILKAMPSISFEDYLPVSVWYKVLTKPARKVLNFTMIFQPSKRNSVKWTRAALRTLGAIVVVEDNRPNYERIWSFNRSKGLCMDIHSGESKRIYSFVASCGGNRTALADVFLALGNVTWSHGPCYHDRFIELLLKGLESTELPHLRLVSLQAIRAYHPQLRFMTDQKIRTRLILAILRAIVPTIESGELSKEQGFQVEQWSDRLQCSLTVLETLLEDPDWEYPQEELGLLAVFSDLIQPTVTFASSPKGIACLIEIVFVIRLFNCKLTRLKATPVLPSGPILVNVWEFVTQWALDICCPGRGLGYLKKPFHNINDHFSTVFFHLRLYTLSFLEDSTESLWSTSITEGYSKDTLYSVILGTFRTLQTIVNTHCKSEEMSQAYQVLGKALQDGEELQQLVKKYLKR